MIMNFILLHIIFIIGLFFISLGNLQYETHLFSFRVQFN